MSEHQRWRSKARLARLRRRAAARREAFPGDWSRPEQDARLSAENVPFMALQAETSSWRDKDDLDLTSDDLTAMIAEGKPEGIRGPEDSARLSGATRGEWFLCCMGGWRRVLCWLDNVNHEHLGSRVRIVCDLHDRALTGMTLREVRTNH